jgi:hypothetical protein
LLCTAAGVPKQLLHQFVAVRNFNSLRGTYLLGSGKRGGYR